MTREDWGRGGEEGVVGVSGRGFGHINTSLEPAGGGGARRQDDFNNSGGD